MITFKRRFSRALLIGLTTTFLISGCGSDSSEPVTPKNEQPQPTETKKSSNPAAQTLGEHWIKDANDVYIWNPKPQEGETVNWSGGFVQEGNYKFADGNGTVTWYLNGEVEQIDEGTLKKGQRHGRFKHEFFPSGNVIYTNWNSGVEITDAQETDDVIAAKNAFISYHKAITNKNYREAYEILSYKQRERVGDFDSWVKGFSNTISSEVSNLTLTSSEGDAYTFDYTLQARDRHSDGNVKVQVFKGQVTMAKDKGKWYVRYAKSSRIDEKIVDELEREQKVQLASEQKKREEMLANTSAEKDLAKAAVLPDNASTKDYLESIQPFALADLTRKVSGIMGLLEDGSVRGLEDYIIAMTLLADNERARNTAISRDVARYFEYEAEIAAVHVAVEKQGFMEKIASLAIVYELGNEKDEVEEKIRATAKDCGADLSSYAETETIRRIISVINSL